MSIYVIREIDRYFDKNGTATLEYNVCDAYGYFEDFEEALDYCEELATKYYEETECEAKLEFDDDGWIVTVQTQYGEEEYTWELSELLPHEACETEEDTGS